jgi:glyoxylase-like metal-dependent hydrolase (beta-lactamase superfamily II)
MTAGLPESLVERARALAGGEHVPPVPRHASTVVLVREPLEVYLIRRVKGMAFAGGMHVFPGGSVDDADAHADVGWAGPPAAWWGELFGADEALGRALVCAAVRETFEESGVLLAGPSETELLADVSSDEWEEERRALEAREQSLSELLARRGLVLRADLLRPLAHWITPEVDRAVRRLPAHAPHAGRAPRPLGVRRRRGCPGSRPRGHARPAEDPGRGRRGPPLPPPGRRGLPGLMAVGQLRQVTPTAGVVLCGNPGPMTLEGTNTWVLRTPGNDSCVVVDPGPLMEEHLQAVAALGPVDVVLLTHGHHDHSAGAARFAELTGARVRALDPAHRLGDLGLGEGDVVTGGGLEVRVLATPGHSADSLSFVLPDAVLTGDTVLGRGTTVVAHPDGVLADYLESLRRLRELGELMVLPGHGPELASAGAAADHYLAHREGRLEQVRAAVEAGATTPDEVVEVVYADVDRVLWPAARMSVEAQLLYLRS